MKLFNIVDDLKLIITHGLIPQDIKISDDLIVQWVNNQRALWLANEYNKGRDIRNNEKQVLKNVKLETVDGSTLSTDFNSGITVLKSVRQIPRNLQLLVRDAITSIRPLNVISERVNLVPREQAVYSGNGILNRNKLFAFKHDDYIFIKYGDQANKSDIITSVAIEGVFEDPLVVNTFNDEVDYIWDGIDDYPISAHFIEYLKAQILQANVQVFMQMHKDNSQNDEHDN